MHFTLLLYVFCFFFINFHKRTECNARKFGPPFRAVEFIAENGYASEIYELNANNNYALQMFRIFDKKLEPDSVSKSAKKAPVFLQHGFLASSDFYLLNGREYGLPFLLVDEGFDVWMGNVKGNKYGRPSNESQYSDSQFWNFTWHDLALKDLSTQLDFVYEQSGKQKINFVGHSMGATMLFVLLSQKPEYNDKINNSFLMSPMVYMTNIKSLAFRSFHEYFNDYKKLEKQLGTGEINLRRLNFLKVVRQHCEKPQEPECNDQVWVVTGTDPQHYSTLAMDVLDRQFKGKTSVRCFGHYGQLYNSGHFRQFDYGKDGNMAEYGKPDPPDYNLENVKIPIDFYLAKSDYLSNETDVSKFVKELKGVVNVNHVNKSDFYHLDFLLSKDAKKEVYQDLIHKLKG